MSMTLSIPIKQQITLPDAWQACRTPQELSYWLIAKFETFEADVEAAAAAAAEASNQAQTALATAQAAGDEAVRALNAISNLDAQVVQLSARVTSLSSDLTAAEGNITALTARMTTAETNISNLDNAVNVGIPYEFASVNNRLGNLETNVTVLQSQRLQTGIAGLLRQQLAKNDNIDFNSTVCVDMGVLAWVYSSANNYFYVDLADKMISQTNILSTRYQNALSVTTGDKTITSSNTVARVYVRDDAYTDVASFTAAVKGALLAYGIVTTP